MMDMVFNKTQARIQEIARGSDEVAVVEDEESDESESDIHESEVEQEDGDPNILDETAEEPVHEVASETSLGEEIEDDTEPSEVSE
jgi:hypothetical protein